MKIQRLTKQLGQGMMEYVIIVALIAVAAIGGYSMFGKTIRNQTAGLSKEVAGQNSSEQISNAGESATAASDRGNTAKGMGEYNKDNDQKGK